MLRATYVTPVAVALAVFAALTCARELGWLQPADLALHDVYTRGTQRSHQPPPDVSMLYITEEDIRELGHWPISDRELASALRRLAEGGARIIGLDIYRDLPVPPGEAQLEAVLQSHENIISVHKFGDPEIDGIAGPWPLRPKVDGEDFAAREGFNDVIPDANDWVRRGLLFLDHGDEGPVDYAFALRIALLALQREGIYPAADPDHRERMRLGAATFRPFEAGDGGYVDADAGGYQILLNFSRDSGDFPSFSLLSLLRAEVDPELIRDRIVMVGSNAPSLRDYFRVPSAVASEEVAGIALHAHITQQILDSARGELPTLRVLPEWQETALVLTGVVAGSILGLVAHALGVGPAGVAAAALLGTAGLAGAGYAIYASGLWIPIVGPCLAWLLSLSATSVWAASRDRAWRDALARLFPASATPELARRLWGRRSELFSGRRPRAHRLKATVLVMQMEGPAADVEKLHPEQMVDWLDAVMSPMLELVASHDGILEVFSGDGLRASFGAPLPRRSEQEFGLDASNAVQCAMQMMNVLATVNARHWQLGLPSATFRVGIHTGWVVGGGLGRQKAQSGRYVLTGAEVFTARELATASGVAHDFDRAPCRILVSQATRRYLGEEITTESLGSVALRGTDHMIDAHRVIEPRA